MAEQSVQEAKAEQLSTLINIKEQVTDALDEIESAHAVIDDLTNLFYVLGQMNIPNKDHLARVGCYATVHLWADINGVKIKLIEASESSASLSSKLETIWRLEREVRQ